MRFSERLWEHSTGSIKPVVWFWAGLTSVLFLGVILSLVDWQQLSNIINNISLPTLCIAMLVLSAEGLFTALRIKTFTPGSHSLINCLQVVAWFVVLLIVLPARLGEIAIIFLIGHFLKQSKSSAFINAFTQRLLDLIVLTSFFIVTVFCLTKTPNASILISIAVIILSLLVIMLLVLKPVLVCLTVCFKLPSNNTFPAKIEKNLSVKEKLIRGLHNGTKWHQELVTHTILVKGFILSIGKWICNLGGIVLLLSALNIPLSFFDNTFLAAAYNFLAIVPLQSVGGFGVSEAGLAGLLVLLGLDINYSASISLMTRVFLIFNPMVFWLFVSLAASLLRSKEK